MAIPTSSALSQPGYGIPQLQSLDDQTPPGFITPGAMQSGFDIGTGLEELNLAEILGIAKAAPSQVLQAPVMGSKAFAGGSGLSNIGGAAAAGLAPGDVSGEVDPLEGTTFGQRFLMNINPAYAKAFTQRQALKRKTDAAREVTGLIAESNKLAMQGDLEGAEELITERMKTFKYAPEAQAPALDQIKYLRTRQSQSAFAKMMFNAAKNQVDDNPQANPLFREVVALGREAEAKAKLRKGGQPDYSSIIAAIGTEGLQPLINAMASSRKTAFTPEGGALIEDSIAGTIESLPDVNRPVQLGQLFSNEFMQDAVSLLGYNREFIRANINNPDEQGEEARKQLNAVTLKAQRMRDARAMTHSDRGNVTGYTERQLIDMPEGQFEQVAKDIRGQQALQQGNFARETEIQKNLTRKYELHDDAINALEDARTQLLKMEDPSFWEKFARGAVRLHLPYLGSLSKQHVTALEKEMGVQFTRNQMDFLAALAKFNQASSDLYPQNSEDLAYIRAQLDPNIYSNVGLANQAFESMSERLWKTRTSLDDPLYGRPGRKPPESKRGLQVPNKPATGQGNKGNNPNTPGKGTTNIQPPASPGNVEQQGFKQGAPPVDTQLGPFTIPDTGLSPAHKELLDHWRKKLGFE